MIVIGCRFMIVIGCHMSSSRRKKLNRKKIEIKNGIIFLMDRNCNSLKDRGIRVQEDVYEYDKHTVRYLS